ncbi:MAG TPA: MBL fold metallo-hydrolase, partial [Candidatus Limnocylindrales bacterium]|nr:MBL fold metallo-hydrolase [Candidatus Limnocylindrales bacterium]
RAKGRRARDGKTFVPTSLDGAFDLVGPGEYEISHVLMTGVRTYRDDEKGARRGLQTAFVIELDGMHTIHLGDIGHLLTEEKLSDIGSVDIACVPIGGALSASKAAELVAQLDPRIVIAMPVTDVEADAEAAVGRFFHEMGETPSAQAKLSISLSGLPTETTTVLLESRSKSA